MRHHTFVTCAAKQDYTFRNAGHRSPDISEPSGHTPPSNQTRDGNSSSKYPAGSPIQRAAAACPSWSRSLHPKSQNPAPPARSILHNFSTPGAFASRIFALLKPLYVRFPVPRPPQLLPRPPRSSFRPVNPSQTRTPTATSTYPWRIHPFAPAKLEGVTNTRGRARAATLAKSLQTGRNPSRFKILEVSSLQ